MNPNMPGRQNAASRLYEIFGLLPAKSSDSAKIVWAESLGRIEHVGAVDPNDSVHLARKLVEIADQIQHVADYAIAQGKPPHTWQVQLDGLKRALMLDVPGEPWGGPGARVSPDMLLALAWFAEEMPDEGGIDADKDEIEMLIEQLQELITSLYTAELPPSIKQELLELAEQMLSAITNVGIRGPLAAQRTFVQTAAALNELEPVLRPYQGSPVVSGFRNFMKEAATVAGYTAAIAKGVELSVKAIRAVHDFLQIGSGPPI